MAQELGRLTDLRQSPSYAKFMVSLGWTEITIGPVRAFIRRIPLVGTIIRVPRPNLPLPLDELENLAREKRAVLLKVEPNVLVDHFHPKLVGSLSRDRHPILPTRTRWVDLTQSENKLFSDLDKDTRNLVRRAEKDGVSITQSKDLASFYKLWELNARDKGFFTPFAKEMTDFWKSFAEKHLLVARYHGKVVAAAILFGYAEGSYYAFAASNDVGRRAHAPYLLAWEAIRRAKKWGYARFDFEGVTDPAVKRTSNWAGFSHFKKGFGGREVEYIGSFSKSYSPLGKLIGRFL